MGKSLKYDKFEDYDVDLKKVKQKNKNNRDRRKNKRVVEEIISDNDENDKIGKEKFYK